MSSACVVSVLIQALFRSEENNQESLQEEADRMEKLLRELKEREERTQLVGEEDEAASLRVQIANVENLQLALPRPNIIG